MASQARVRVFAGLCVIAPFVVVVAFKIQTAVPQDTLFGQWVHTSGFAVPLVILGFAGLWGLPLLTSLVAGDIFSCEDHFGTWKAILTRSRSRADVFAGKVVAAVTYTAAMLVLLAAASMLAGLVMGTQPVVGLSGQLVPAGRAEVLVLASWGTQFAPLLAFCGIAILLSVTSRNSVVGIVGTLVVGLVLQLVAYINMPLGVRDFLPVAPFFSWHGFWVKPAFYTPLYVGAETSALWFIACVTIAWLVFRARSIDTA